MCDLISVIEELLVSESCSLNGALKFKLYKNKKKLKDGDYICYYRYCADDYSLTYEMLQLKFLEMAPCLREYLQIKESPHGLSIFLDRNFCFLNCFNEISISCEKYGNNKMFEDKVFHCTVDIEKESRNLTSLRLKLVDELLSEMLLASGGCFKENESTELIYINVTKKNEQIGSKVNVLVGPVFNDSSSEHISVDSQRYERLRQEEINGMSEHKLELNEALHSLKDLVRLSILFDLLQSNISRPLTLRLLVDDVDRKTSCKGSLFVMYNFVRFHRISESFSEAVKKGKYPTLPPLSKIDFSLLSDDEWFLTLNFLLEWPSVVRKCLLDLNSGRPKVHLLFNFITSFSLQCSQYYHRTRILVEPRSHLLPVLFARIYFIRCINQIFLNCFKMLNITPLMRM